VKSDLNCDKTFASQTCEHVRENRSRLLSAALTIARGYIVAGKPTHGLPSWGSFEGWSAFCARVSGLGGMPDPAETRAGIHEHADRDALNMRRDPARAADA
jgi:hypothetical protein